MKIPNDWFAVNSMLRSLEWLERFSHIPFKISEEANEYVVSLAPLCSTPETPLSDFILRLPLYALQNEVRDLAIPQQNRKLLIHLGDEHDKLAKEKENAVANQNFDTAARFRDKQLELDKTISELLQGPIVVASQHVSSAIRRLGFAGNLPDSNSR
jgi:hypothetical protein